MRDPRLFLGCLVLVAHALSLSARDPEVTGADPRPGSIIGYLKIAVPQGVSLVASPLNTLQEQLVAELLRQPPDLTEVVVLREGLTITNTYGPANGWDDPTMTLVPYEAFQITTSESFILTFVGELPSQAHPFARSIPAGESWSGVPVPGLPWDRQLFPAVEGVTIWRLETDGSRQQVATFSGNQWVPAPPNIPAGTGFMVQSPVSLYWSIIYIEPNFIRLNPGPASIRNLPERLVAAPNETVVLQPIVDGPRPMITQWQHQHSGVLPVSAYSIKLPNSGGCSQGVFTLNVTDADGHTNSASIRVERYDGSPVIRPGSWAGKPAFELYGRTGQAHRLLVSHDLAVWTQWTLSSGVVRPPVWLDPESEFGNQQPLFLRLVAD